MKSVIQKLSFLVGLIFLFGIQQISAQTYYWVGGTGDWSDTSHWSNQSGAAGSAIYYSNPPSIGSNVIFDTNSFITSTDTVYFNVGKAEINSMFWTHSLSGSTSAPRFQSNSSDSIILSGSLILDPLMDHAYLGKYFFKSNSNNDSLVTAGHAFFNDIHISNFGNTFKLYDDLSSTGGIFLSRGAFDMSDRNLNIRFFRSTNSTSRQVYVENTNFHLFGSDSVLLVNSNQITKFGTNEIFHIDYTGIDPVEISMGNETFLWNQLLLNNTVTQFIGSAYFNSVNALASKKMIINSDKILRSPNFNLSGNCGKYFDIINSGINQGYIHNDGVGVTMAYGRIKNISVIAPGVGQGFTATYSLNLGGNFNISFPNFFTTNTYYWVGGKGNFYDPTHWSLSSGGIADACFPSSKDNVVFDANSGGIDTLFLLETVRVRSANFSAITSPLHLSGQGEEFKIVSKLTGSALLSSDWTGQFTSNGTFELQSNGTVWENDFVFSGNGQKVLLDDFQSTKNIHHLAGPFFSLGHNMTLSSFIANEGIQNRSMDFSGSNVTITGSAFNFSDTSLINGFLSPNELNFTNVENDFVFFHAGEFTYNNVNVNTSNIQFISDTIQMNILTIQPGSSVIFDNESDHFFNDIIANGSCTAPILFRSSSANDAPAILHRNANVQTSFSEIIVDNIIPDNAGEYLLFNSTALNLPFNHNWTQSDGISTKLINFGGASLGAGTSTSLTQPLVYNPPGLFTLSSVLTLSGVSTTSGTNIDSCRLGLQSIFQPSGFVIQSIPNDFLSGPPYSFSFNMGTANRDLQLDLANDNTVGGTFTIANAEIVISYVEAYTPPTPETYYWYGGSGDWSDINHWSLNSGNSPPAPATCTPIYVDNVIFDDLSFNSPNDTVVVNVESYVNDITWTSTVQPATFLVEKNLTTFGDVLFQPNLAVTRTNKEARFTFQPILSVTDFNPNGALLDVPLILLAPDSLGVLNIQSDLIMTDSSIIVIGGGKFVTNDFDIRTGTLFIGSVKQKTIRLGSSKVNLHYGFQEDFNTSYLVFDAGTSSIEIDYIASDTIYDNYFTSKGHDFYDVSLNFNNEVYSSFTGNNSFHDLKIGAGSKITMASGSTQTVSDSLVLVGNCADSIYLVSSNPTSAYTIDNLLDLSHAECVNVQDASINGPVITALFSTDGGNNTSWIFDTTPSITAQLGSISNYCFEDTLQFAQTSSAYYGSPTITWSFGNGIIYNGDTTQYAYPTSGTFTLQFVAESVNFCKANIDTVIKILDPKVSLSSNETDLITCQGYTTDFYSSAQPDTLITYQYFINGNSLGPPTLEMDTLSLTTLNNMDTVQVKVVEQGCVASSSQLIFTVNPIPTTAIFSNVGTTICSGDTVKLYGTGADKYQLYKNGVAITPFSADTVVLSNISHLDTLHFMGRFNGTLCELESSKLIFTVNSLPSASLIDDDSTSNTICQGDTVNWTASSATGIMYSFLVNNSVIFSSASPTYGFPGLNQGDISTVIATDALGCNSPVSNALFYTVNAIPTPTLTSDVATICQGDLINFLANGVSNYTFLVNDVAVAGPSGANYYASSTLNNLDEVKVFGTLNNCPAFSNTIIVDVTPTPTTNLVSDLGDTICQNDLPQVTAVSSLATSFEFFINSISQGPVSSSNIFIATSPITNGSVISVKSYLNGCEAQDQINFLVNPSPIPTIFTDINSDTICQSDPVTISGTGGSTYTFFVNGVDQGVSTSTLLTDTLSPGPNEVYVVATSNLNCSTTSDSLDLFIVGLPTVNLTSNIPSNTICAGTPMTFTASPGAEKYQFFLNSNSLGLPSSSNTYTSSFIANGDTIAVVAYNNGCPKNGLDTVIVTVINNPTASLSGTTIFCASAPQVFTAGTGSNYQFFLNSISQGPASSTNTYNSGSLSPGNYALQVLVEDNGCTATSALNITVLTTPTVSISGNNLICSGTNTIFQGTGASTYQFYVNGTLSGSSNTFATNSLANGDVVSLIGQTLAGCPSTNTAQISMTVNTTPVVTLISDDVDGILCQGQNVLFTATGASSYEFFVNGNTTGAPSANNTYSTSTITNGQTVSVTGATNGCFDTESLPLFTVVNYPVVTLTNSGDTSLCTGDLTQLSVSGASDYLYYVNGVPQGTFSPTTTFNNTVANGDIITVEGMTNTCVSLANTSVQYTVFNYPATSLTSSAVNNEICFGESVTFTGSGATNYSFSLDNVPTGNSGSTYTNTELTDGQVVQLIGSNGQCSTPAPSIIMIVNTMNLASAVSPTNYMICEGEDLTFQSSGADEYEVFINGISQGAQSALSSYTLSNLNDLDIITFTGYSNTTTCTQLHNESTYIHVTSSPLITIDQNTTICEGDSTTLSSNSSYGNQWLLNGVPITGASDTSIVVFNSGDYSLSVTKGGNGNIWSQGYNGNGEIGNGNNFNSANPSEAANLSNALDIRSGLNHTMAILPGGAVYVWGSNLSGQLGNGTFTSSNLPIQLTSLPSITDIDGGDKFTLAVSTAGNLYAWGANSHGQLGLNNTTVYNTPQLVASQQTVVDVAAGNGHSIILKSNGTVWTAGNNDFGQLGIGNLTSSASFAQVPGLTNIVSIEAGEYHSMAIDALGNLYLWGNNGNGQLGLNDLTDRTSPEVSLLKKVTQVSGGNSHTIAVKENGSVYTMGANSHGQLGTNDTQNQLVPQKIPQLNAVKSISAGQYLSLILKKDGTVLGTGRNNENAINTSAALIIDSFEIIEQLDGVTGIDAGRGVTHFIFGNEKECSAQAVTMTVNPAPLPTVFYTNGNLSTSVTNVATYQWFINGVAILNSDTSLWTPNANGFYTVLVVYQNGCSRLSGQYPIGVTGLYEISQEMNTVIYPNPTNGQTNVVWNQKGFYKSFVILDVTGRQIMHGEITNEMLELPLDLMDQSTGMYHLVLTSSHGELFKHKLIKL